MGRMIRWLREHWHFEVRWADAREQARYERRLDVERSWGRFLGSQK